MNIWKFQKCPAFHLYVRGRATPGMVLRPIRDDVQSKSTGAAADRVVATHPDQAHTGTWLGHASKCITRLNIFFACENDSKCVRPSSCVHPHPVLLVQWRWVFQLYHRPSKQPGLEMYGALWHNWTSGLACNHQLDAGVKACETDQNLTSVLACWNYDFWPS